MKRGWCGPIIKKLFCINWAALDFWHKYLVIISNPGILASAIKYGQRIRILKNSVLRSSLPLKHS